MTKKLVAAFLLGLVLLGSPRSVRADSDFTTPLLISGIVAGVVVVIYLVAIAGASNEEPEFLLPSRRLPEPDRVRVGPRCGTPGVLFCW